MLAGAPGGGAGVLLDGGGLVRFRFATAPEVRLSTFDVIQAQVDADELLPFAGDALILDAPRPIGRMAGRAAERILRPLVHPTRMPLLGTASFSVPFWSLPEGNRSLALVEPASGLEVERRGLDRLRCRFRWRRLDHDLPIDDPALVKALGHPSTSRLDGRMLARTLGWKPHRLVVALTPPRTGVCHKVVAALLPRP